jgi:hypothetical protein
VSHKYSLTVLKYNPEIKDIHLDPKPTPIIEKIVSKKIELPGISDLQPRRVSWSDNRCNVDYKIKLYKYLLRRSRLMGRKVGSKEGN